MICLEKSDEDNLALMGQETTASGEKSSFNKLVQRSTMGEQRPRARTAS